MPLVLACSVLHQRAVNCPRNASLSIARAYIHGPCDFEHGYAWVIARGRAHGWLSAGEPLESLIV